MSRVASGLMSLGQLGQKASGAAKAVKDSVVSSKTFKSLQGTMSGLLKSQKMLAQSSKKSGALQFLQKENEKEFQREQMEFWQILLQKLDSIEKKLDKLGVGGGKDQKKGLLSKLFDMAMGILGITNALIFLRQIMPKLLGSIRTLNARILNLTRRAVGLPEKPIQPKPTEAKPGETKPGQTKPGEMKPGEEVKPGEKPKTPVEISEEAKARVAAEQAKIAEIRTQLEKIYDALEKNAAEIQKAREAGNTEAVKRLTEMERLYQQDISEIRKELKSAQEKLVETRDVAAQMEKAAIEGEKGFFERLKQGFDTLFEDLKKIVNDTKIALNENAAKVLREQAKNAATPEERAALEEKATQLEEKTKQQRGSEPTKPTAAEPTKPTAAPEAPKTTTPTAEPVVDTTAPKTVTDTINTGKGFTDTAVTVDKLITERAVDVSAREAVFRDVMNAKSAFDGGATEYVSKETGIKYTAEMAKGVDDAGRRYVEKITADTTNIKTEFAPKVSQTTPTGTPTGETTKPAGTTEPTKTTGTAESAPKTPTPEAITPAEAAPKAAEPVKPVRPAALDAPAPTAENAPKTPAVESSTTAAPKPTSNTASILQRTGRFIRPGVAITPGEIGRNLKATGEGLKTAKGAVGGAAGIGAFSALQLANRWLNGEDISQEDIARQLTTDVAFTAGAAGVLAVLPGLGPAAGPLALAMGAYLGYEVLSSWRRTRNLEEEASKHEAEINTLSKSTDPQDRMDLLGYMQYLSDWSQMEDYRASNIPFFPSDPKDPTDRQRTAKMQEDWLSQHPLPNIEDYVKGGKKQEEAIKKQSFAMLSSKILNDIVTENVQKYEQGSPGIFGSMLEVFLPQSSEWSEQVRSSFASDLDGYFLNLPQSDIDLITEVAGTQEIAKEQIRQQFNVLDKSQFEEIRAAIDPEFAKQVEIRENAEAARGVGYNTGGYVPGPAHIKHDTVPAMLTPGEFVVRKDAVNSIGLSTLYAMNEGVLPQVIGYSEGGLVAEPAIVIPNTEIYPQQYFEDSLKPQNSFDKQYDISIDENTGRVITEATDPTSGLKYEVVGEEATIALVSNLEKLRQAINENTLVFGDMQTAIPLPKNEDLLKMSKEDLVTYVKETLKAVEQEQIEQGSYVYEPTQEEVDARVAYEIALAEGNTKEAERLLQEVKRESVRNDIRRDREIKDAVNKLLKQIELIKTEMKAEESEVSVNERRAEELISEEAAPQPVAPQTAPQVAPEAPKVEVDPVERKKLEDKLKKTEQAISRIEQSIEKVQDNRDGINKRTRMATLERNLEKKLQEREEIIKQMENLSAGVPSAPTTQQAETPKEETKPLSREERIEQNVNKQLKESEEMISIINRNLEMLEKNPNKGNNKEQITRLKEMLAQYTKTRDILVDQKRRIEENKTSTTSVAETTTPTDNKAVSETNTAQVSIPEDPKAKEERKKQQEIELSNLKDRSDTSYIVWQRATEQLSQDIKKGLSDEDYQARQKEVNDLFAFHEEEYQKYISLMDEMRKERRQETGPVEVETRSAEEIMESVYRTMRNTPTGFEASMPPERMMLEPDTKTPNSSWFTMLASASQIYNNPSIVSDIQQISRSIANSAESGLYQTNNTQSIPRAAEPIPEWSSQRKPIMASLFEETFNRLERTMSTNNQSGPITVNNNPTMVSNSGGGGGGDFASIQNSPRFSRVESDVISQMTAENRGRLVV